MGGEGHPRARRERLPLLQAGLEPRGRCRTRHAPGEPDRAPVARRQGALALDMQDGRGRGHEEPRHEDVRPARAREPGVLRTEPDRAGARRVQDARPRRPAVRTARDFQPEEARAAEPMGEAPGHAGGQRWVDRDRAPSPQDGPPRPLSGGEHPERGDHRAEDVPGDAQVGDSVRDVRARRGDVRRGEGAHPPASSTGSRGTRFATKYWGGARRGRAS